MANSFSANVIYVDTSAAFVQASDIVGIKYIGASTSSIEILGNASSGGPSLYINSATTAQAFEPIEIRDNKGVYVTVSGTATCYIYLRTDWR